MTTEPSDAPAAAAPPGPRADACERYDVFISYSRKDTAFVARLERALESYKAPASLARERRRLNVFRDAEDLIGPDYGASIQEYLRRSSRLLVISSPNARRSRYVDQEIEWFLAAHDRANVISVLLDGVPNNEAAADDPALAFPAQLCKAHEIPLAADYRGFDVARHKPAKPPYDGAWYTLLANIYGIDRNTVEQRDRLRQRRERRVAAAISGAVMVSLAFAAAFSWVQMRRAEAQRDVAVRGFARYLALQSEGVRSVDPEQALLLAVEAARTTHDVDATVTEEAELALRRGLAETGGMRLGTGASNVRFSPDGRRLARIEESGTVTVWDLDAPAAPPVQIALPDALSRAEFGPANRLAIIAKGGGEAVLLDLGQPGGAPRRIAARSGSVQSLELSADGSALLLLDRSPDIMVVSLADADAPPALLQGHASRRIGGEASGVRTAVFGATGRWIASSGWDNTLRLWDRQAGGTAPRTLLADISAGTPRFSPDDRWLLVFGNRPGELAGRYTLWNLESEPRIAAIDAAGVPPESVAPASSIFGGAGSAFMASDRLVLAARDATFVFRLDAAGARLERTIPETLAALGGDARHFATTKTRNEDNDVVTVVSLWDVDGTEPDAEVEVPAALDGLGYAAAGRRLVALTDAGELWSWELDRRDFESSPRRHLGATGNMLAVSADGRAAVVGYSYGDSRLWSLTNASVDPVRVDEVDERAELEARQTSSSSSSSVAGSPQDGLPQMLAFDTESRQVAMPRNDGVLAVVDLERPNGVPLSIPVDERGVSAVAFSPDGATVAAADRNLTIRLWRVRDPAQPFAQLRVPSEEGSASSVSALAFSHDGRRLAAGGAFGTVGVWDLSTPAAEPLTLANHADWITTVAFSADDRSVLVAAADGKASLVSLADPASPRMLEGHTGFIRAAFSAADEFVVTAGRDATVRVWSVRDAQAPPRVLRGHAGPITTFAVTPLDQRVITVSDDGSLRVWKLDEDRPEKIVELQAPVGAIAVSHDGRWLASANFGPGGVDLRSMDALERAPLPLPMALPVAKAGDPELAVFALRFSPDDHWLAALAPGEGKLWRMRVEDLVQLACDSSGRNFEAEEWESYLTDVPYRFTCAGWGLGPHYLDTARREAERGSFDHAAQLFRTAKALVPTLPFDADSEARRIAVEGALDRGRSLARRGEPDAALAELGRIRQIDPASTVDPQREIARVAQAKSLVAEAAKQARAGELDAAVAKYRDALELDPGLGIDAVKETNGLYAPVLVEQGRAAAAAGRMEEGVALLERADRLDPRALFDTPELDARSARAEALMTEAGKLAEGGDLQGAIAGYRAALAVDARRRIDPEVEAGKRVAALLIEQAFASPEPRAGIELFDRALALDPGVSYWSSSANGLCWRAVQAALARQALNVCEAAVAEDAESWMARDSRGVARALVGQIAGAIEDFELYVKESDRDDSVAQRERWIAALKSGWRPRTFAELDAK